MSSSTLFVNTLIKLTQVGQCLAGQLDFSHDTLVCPSGLSPLTVQISVKVPSQKLKLKLLDCNGCVVASLCIPCDQYQWIEPDGTLKPTPEAGDILQINVLNPQLMAKYLELEGKAFYLRESTVNVHNLFCNAECKREEGCDIIQQVVDNNTLLNKLLTTIATTSTGTTLADILVDAGNLTQAEVAAAQLVSNSVHLDLLKMRIVAQVELCECGKSCVDTCFVRQPSFCEGLLGCDNGVVGVPDALRGGYFRHGGLGRLGGLGLRQHGGCNKC
jgi:hypothetical protein